MSIYQVNPELVKQISWQNDPIAYDQALFSLGKNSEEFIVPNPNVAVDLNSIIKRIPFTDRCVVWYYQGQWIAKRFTQKWKPQFGYYDIEISDTALKFNFLWTKNPDLNNIKFSDSPYREYQPAIDESYYELVWYIDPRFNPTEEEVWAFKCKNQGENCLGIKHMGYVTPYYEISYNPYLPQMDYELDINIPWWELDYTYQWLLATEHCESAPEEIWAVRIDFVDEPRDIRTLGEISPKFDLIQNPNLPQLNYDIDYPVPYYDFEYEHIWMLDNRHCETAPEDIWALKVRFVENPKGTKIIDSVSPVLSIELNPNLPDLNYDIDYEIPYYDLGYEHVWMLDNKHCETAVEDIWAVKISATDSIEGTKIVGSLSPILDIELNPDLPELEYDIDYTIPYHDLGYEHVWLLDSKHCENAPEDIWAVKVRATEEVEGSKIVSSVSPILRYEYNPSLPQLSYDINYEIPYHDLGYEHVWLLDSKHCETAPEDIWAVKISAVIEPTETKIVAEVSPVMNYQINKDVDGYDFDIPQTTIQYHDFSYTYRWMLDTDHSGYYDIWAIKGSYVKNAKGEKAAGYVVPKQELLYNKDLKNIPRIKVDYKIPYHDRKYLHVWYLNENFTSGEKVWVAKLAATKNPKGTKEMGIVTPILPDYLDVFFISYYEPNAEENWKRVLEKAPYAKRIDGVKGIFEAHRAAAEQSNSDMFYVVDGDAYLVDSWKFNYQPGVFDRDCAYVWKSKNPVNGLSYGYGGVKLFSKKEFLKVKTLTNLDMTTTIMSKLRVMQKVSNITAFNTDEFSTWKSAFRECVKLKFNAALEPDNQDHIKRLAKWKTANWKKTKKTPKFAEYATDGAIDAVQFFEKEKHNKETLLKINDMDWLRKQFNKKYGKKNSD